MVARAFVAKPEDFGTANPTLWDSVESDGLDPGPTTSSALHESRNSPNFARNVNTNSLNRARNPSFSGDFLHAIALISECRRLGSARLGVAWLGVAWRGVAWRGVAWRGVAWRGVAWRGAARRDGHRNPYASGAVIESWRQSAAAN